MDGKYFLSFSKKIFLNRLGNRMKFSLDSFIPFVETSQFEFVLGNITILGCTLGCLPFESELRVLKTDITLSFLLYLDASHFKVRDCNTFLTVDWTF